MTSIINTQEVGSNQIDAVPQQKNAAIITVIRDPKSGSYPVPKANNRSYILGGRRVIFDTM